MTNPSPSETNPTFVKDEMEMRFVKHLVESIFTDCPHRIKALKLLPTSMISKGVTVSDDDNYYYLVTQEHSRGCCDKALEAALEGKPGTRVVITGPPGIGKSWHLFYMLRDLLIKREYVLLADRKSNMYFKFTPLRDSPYPYLVETCISSSPDIVLNIGKHFKVLVDPNPKGNDIDGVKGVNILVFSSHSRHFYKRSTDGMVRFFMEMVTWDELLVAA